MQQAARRPIPPVGGLGSNDPGREGTRPGLEGESENRRPSLFGQPGCDARTMPGGQGIRTIQENLVRPGESLAGRTPRAVEKTQATSGRCGHFPPCRYPAARPGPRATTSRRARCRGAVAPGIGLVVTRCTARAMIGERQAVLRDVQLAAVRRHEMGVVSLPSGGERSSRAQARPSPREGHRRRMSVPGGRVC